MLREARNNALLDQQGMWVKKRPVLPIPVIIVAKH
jgi:hypothetical protein